MVRFFDKTPPEIIFHIGHFKTGTTALQVFFQANRGKLARQGLVYARTHEKLAKHSPLAHVLYHEAGVQSLLYNFQPPAPARDMWQALFDEALALKGGQSLLVSSEAFMRLGAHPGAEAALRALIDTVRDRLRFRVVCYLRAPQSHLESWYNQLIKIGFDVPGFDATVEQVMEPIHWDYAQALRPWIDIFGRDAVILRGFTPALRRDDAMYRDFLNAIGQPFPARAGPPDADPNPRLDEKLLPIKRGMQHVPARRWVKTAMMQDVDSALSAETRAPQWSEPRPPLTFEQIRDRALTGLDTLAALPGAALDLAAMRADPPRPQDPARRETAEMFAILSSEIARLRERLATQAQRIKTLEDQLGKPQAPAPAKAPDETPAKAQGKAPGKDTPQ